LKEVAHNENGIFKKANATVKNGIVAKRLDQGIRANITGAY